jgi:Domain of unknown function (DUF4214)
MSRSPFDSPRLSAARGKDSYRPRFEILEDRCLLAADFHTLPVIPAISQSMKTYLQSIYQLGQSQGERANVFMKVGDSNTYNPSFLEGLGAVSYNPSNPALVGADHTDLAATIDYFREQSVDPAGENSFDHISAASFGGWSSTIIMTPGARGVQPWLFGPPLTSPLDAEIRQTKPAIALIMVGTIDVGQQNPVLFGTNLTLMGQDLLSQGVIPVFSTLPEDLLPLPGLLPLTSEYNQIIADVAGNLNVPLWNLYVGLSQLPNEGISSDDVHLIVSPNGADLLDDANVPFGMNYRNLTAVETLARVVGVVEENQAPTSSTPPAPTPPDRSGPAPTSPFVAALFEAILQRPADPSGLALFSNEISTGTSAGVVVQQIWTSAEHRQIEIDNYYQQYFHRGVDTFGSIWWQQQFSHGLNEAQVQESLLSSPEYAQDHPTNSVFIEGIYQDVLNRSLGAGDEIYWENQLQSGATRTEVAMAIVQSNEAEGNVVNQFYQIFLGRSAETGAIVSGLALLGGDNGGQLTLVEAVLTSAEFMSKI